MKLEDDDETGMMRAGGRLSIRFKFVKYGEVPCRFWWGRRHARHIDLECIIVVVDILLSSDDEMNGLQTLVGSLKCVFCKTWL